MTTPEWLNDDYVASLLAGEATEPTTTRNKPANLPKPNTRFLRNVIRSTNSHNNALLAKEAAESRARLGDLEQTAATQRLRTNPDAKAIRRRQMGDIRAILGGGGGSRASSQKRARGGVDGDEDAGRGPAGRSATEQRSERRRDHRERSGRAHDLLRGARRRDPDHGRLRESDGDGEDDREPRRSRRSSRRHGPDGDDEQRCSRHRAPPPRRSRSPRQRRPRTRDDSQSGTSPDRRSRSPERIRSGRRRQSKRHGSPVTNTMSHARDASPNDSDPLEALIGPAPAPRYRGRGAVAGSSGIDRRFSASYDPTTDVAMEEPHDGGDDGANGSSSSRPGDSASRWDDAVEAFRDRQKMRRAQEERLRAAGFRDEDVRRMSGDVVDAQDASVQWSKAGEARAWDVGKEEVEPATATAAWASRKSSAPKRPTGLFSEFSDEDGLS